MIVIYICAMYVALHMCQRSKWCVILTLSYKVAAVSWDKPMVRLNTD